MYHINAFFCLLLVNYFILSLSFCPSLPLCRHRGEPKIPDYAATSDEETEDGDFTVYECPGLAPVSQQPLQLCLLVSH